MLKQDYFTNYPHVKQNTLTAAQQMGFRWEQWAGDQLADQGWQVVTPSNFYAGYDLLISEPFGHVLKVEVKSANVTWRMVRSGYYRPRYQFDLGPQKTFDRLFVLIALCADSGEIVPFVLPSWEMGHRQHVQITSAPGNYNGKLLRRYRHNWEMADYTYGIVGKYAQIKNGQMSIFDEVIQ